MSGIQLSLLTKLLSRCLRSVIAGVCVFSFPVIARAQDCSIHNPQIISDSPFDISYSSWVEQVGSAFVYGRCVAVGNDQSANIDWIGAQLKGIVRPGFPQLVTFPFLLELTRERDSELQYGVEPKPERNKKVKLLANEEEENKLRAFIEQQKIKGIAGETLEASISTAVSTAVVHFADIGGKITLDFSSNFRSDLDLGKEYAYSIDYELKASESFDGASLGVPEGTFFLVPQATAIRKGLMSQDFPEGKVPLRGGSNKIDFFLIAEVSDPNERKTTQTISTMDVVQSGKVLASFPVSYFQPADLK